MKKFLFSVLLIGTYAFFVWITEINTVEITNTPPVVIDERQPPTPTPVPTLIPVSAPAPVLGLYKNGIYTSVVADAYYGNVQVKVTITGGKISNVQFLDYPQDRSRSLQISNYAMPRLTTEAIQAQSANVDIISGATATSEAFIQSLASALAQAKV